MKSKGTFSWLERCLSKIGFCFRRVSNFLSFFPSINLLSILSTDSTLSILFPNLHEDFHCSRKVQPCAGIVIVRAVECLAWKASIGGPGAGSEACIQLENSHQFHTTVIGS